MLPVFRRLNQQDIPTAPNWMGYVFNNLNLFCEQVVNTFTKNLVIGENVQGQKYSVTFTTGPTYSMGDFTPIVLSYNGGGTPTCLVLGQVLDSTGAPYGSNAFISDWALNINKRPATITINNISGLLNSKKYTINMVAF